MMIRNIVLAVATIAAFAPALSNASPEKASVKACASAFATSIASPGASAPAYKLAYRGSFGSTLSSFYPSDFTFMLEAHDAKTGLPIARARCSTDSRGTVTEIAVLPLDAKATTLAAAF
ncbi:MAG: hypothetical protein QOD56_451 [Gammaproteobacteria bacterium]|jgi:hypothetical protein|nr:hypothetical protein [Gammaproteobacteria bacterium]